MKRSISAAIVIALLLGTALAIIPASAAEPKRGRTQAFHEQNDLYTRRGNSRQRVE